MKPHYAFVFVLCAVLAACTSIGVAPAKSFPERLAYAYGVNTAVRQAATQGLNAGTLSGSDGEQVLKLTDEARTLLDSAKTLMDIDARGAESKLVLATEILTHLQTYLRTKHA